MSNHLEDIQDCLNISVDSLISAGKTFRQVRARLGDRDFEIWLKKEFPNFWTGAKVLMSYSEIVERSPDTRDRLYSFLFLKEGKADESDPIGSIITCNHITTIVNHAIAGQKV